MSAQTQLLQQSNLLTGRQMVMVVTIALHALVIGALMAPGITIVRMPPDITTIIDFTPPQDPVVPKPQDIPVTIKSISGPVLDIPVPDLTFDVPDTVVAAAAPPNANADVVADAVAPDAGGRGAAVVPQVVSTALQYRAVRSADDYYPAASVRMQEEGQAVVRICVAPSGKIDGKPGIETSSGSPRLDAAALAWAREALRFTPATRGGVAISACKGFRVNFKLH